MSTTINTTTSTVTVPISFRTMYTGAELETRTKALLDVIREPVLRVSLSGGAVNLETSFPAATISDPYPVIVLINGKAGTGKSTFANLVSTYIDSKMPAIELSSVGVIKNVADVLLKEQFDKYESLYTTPPTLAKVYYEEKPDDYRLLIHDIKMAWEKFHDGPNMTTLAEIISRITDTTSPHYGVMFVNIREIDGIKRFKQYCSEIGLMCITMYVDGEKDGITEDGCDEQVESFDYDIKISNKGSLDDLSVYAFIFAKFIVRANMMYGISRSVSEKTILDKKKQDIAEKYLGASITINNPQVDTVVPESTLVKEEASTSNESESFRTVNTDSILPGADKFIDADKDCHMGDADSN